VNFALHQKHAIAFQAFAETVAKMLRVLRFVRTEVNVMLPILARVPTGGLIPIAPHRCVNKRVATEAIALVQILALAQLTGLALIVDSPSVNNLAQVECALLPILVYAHPIGVVMIVQCQSVIRVSLFRTMNCQTRLSIQLKLTGLSTDLATTHHGATKRVVLTVLKRIE
jgi:hypothetical protein